jgi:hypothetical protein
MTVKMAAGNELRQLVDELSRHLQRSVVVNDQAVHLIYASPHYGDEDPARIRAVLYGDGGAELAGWILAQGVNQWRQPHVLQANPDLGMASRFCVPLFSSGWLLGHMMVIDADQSLTSQERKRIELAGAEIAAQLYADRLETDPDHLERQRKTKALLSEHEPTRRDALAFFAKEPNLANAQHVAVTMVQASLGDATKASLDIALNLALETANRTHSRRSLHLVEDNRALLMQTDSSEIHRGILQDQADRIVVELRRSLGHQCRVDIGVGTDHRGLDTAWLARRRADTALRASQRQATTKNAPAVFWADLGVDALLLRLPETDLTWESVPASVRALHEQDRDGKLIHTMGVYLDHGGSIAATAQAMHLHRTTLYYRLDQIRKATGLDLDDGRNRLELHIGLHLLRLIRPSQISDRKSESGMRSSSY